MQVAERVCGYIVAHRDTAPSFKLLGSHPINTLIHRSGLRPPLRSTLIQAESAAQNPPSIISGSGLLFGPGLIQVDVLDSSLGCSWAVQD
jgi:hypothetical protein